MRVAINGLGRIGRNITRQIINNEAFELAHINDINPSRENLAYLLNYDSTYGVLNPSFSVIAGGLEHNGKKITVSSLSFPDQIDWLSLDLDVVIEATGVKTNQDRIGELVTSGIIKKAVVTHSSKDVDLTVIFGVNESSYIPAKHSFVSSSICDANAVAPALCIIDKNFSIEGGSILTLHPWLGYQNLVDGPCRSFAYPGHFEENFALGRASTEAVIPKSTSCYSAVKDVIPNLTPLMSMSFRVPTPVVSSAVLNLRVGDPVNKRDLLDLISNAEKKQENRVFQICDNQLISKDFVGNEHSCIVDKRWLEVDKSGSELRMVLWYDNEYGYSARVLDTIRLLTNG